MTDQTAQLSLYRQWRPQAFSDMVGQEAIVQTLRNAVLAGSVAHAYLFSGERGIGKTSAARILSRAVNCTNPVDGEPCNRCSNCEAILANRSLDIVEIDGASNRGIDHIRQLREEVNFAPTDLKRKVYIIDEVHMLTNEAFNALLKTLEEPPSHAMFIFATTEPHKVPRTIISRCQAFDFRRISPEPIAAHLSHIAAALQVEISPEAVALIAHRANGGMRDALVMLEQVTSYGGASIAEEDVLDMLGLADRTAHDAFLHAVETGDQNTVMELIDQLIERGKDLEIFLSDVITVLRERLRNPSGHLGKTIRTAQGLLAIKADLFRSLDRRIRMEIGVLSLMGDAVHQSPAQPTSAPPEPAVQEAPATPPRPAAHVPEPETPAPTPVSVPAASAQPAPPPPADIPSSDLQGLDDAYKKPWDDMLAEIQQDRIAIAAFLIEGAPDVRDDTLLISFHPEHSFHKASLEMRDNLTYLAGAVRRHFGDAIHVEITTDESVARKPLPHELLMEKAQLVCKAVDGKIVKEDW